jgi:RNA polymerase sigma-70 factor (ECF subfamily)
MESTALAAGGLDDATLLARLQDGDEALFRDFVRRLTPMLLRLARSYTATDATAQDAVQDTWLTVLNKLDDFQGRSSLRTWVCGIAIHTARRSGVRESRSRPFSSVWTDDHSPAVDPDRFSRRRDAAPTGTWSMPPVRWDQSPEERLAEAELRMVIDAAISALPPRQRAIIVARDVIGMDAAEAAAVLALSTGNQRVLLHRARSTVRAELERYGTSVLGKADGRAPLTAPDEQDSPYGRRADREPGHLRAAG